jgi:hypothetical protein
VSGQYFNTPATALSQPDATHIALAAVVVTFGSRTVTYSARTIPISDPGDSPVWLYVTVADPDCLGDTSTALDVYAEPTDDKCGLAGFIYMGTIQCTHAAGSSSIPLPGGWPAPYVSLVGV